MVHQVEQNDQSMSNGLPSSRKSDWRHCYCRGIHGAARERKGLKHAKVTARRRHDKEVIKEQLNEDSF